MQAIIPVSGGTCFGLGARGERAIVGIFFFRELKCETKPFYFSLSLSLSFLFGHDGRSVKCQEAYKVDV